MNSSSCSLYVIVGPSVVCRLWRSCALLRRLKFSAMFLRHRVPWPSVDIQVKFYEDRPRGTPPTGELNRRGVAKYSDFVPIERYTLSRKRGKIGAKLILITNRKSHMSFRLAPNSVTMDDLKRRNSHIRIVILSEFDSFRCGLRKSGWRYASTFCSGNVGHRI